MVLNTRVGEQSSFITLTSRHVPVFLYQGDDWMPNNANMLTINLAGVYFFFPQNLDSCGRKSYELPICGA